MPNLSVRQFIGGLACLLLLAGFIALVVPVHVDGVSCGNGIAADESSYLGVVSERSCVEAVGTRRAWSLPLMGLGVVALVGVGFVGRQQPAESGPVRDQG